MTDTVITSLWERPLVAAIGIVIAAGACGGDDAPETLEPDLDVVLDAAATVMGEVESVRFGIAREGAPVFIDEAELLEFVSAEGRYVAPGSADAVVTISVGGLSTRIGAVAIDGQTWLSNPVTAEWEPAPASFGFDPATLFDPELGWRPLLAEGLENPRLVGQEERNRAAVYHVQGVAGAERVAIVTAGLVRGQDVAVDLWLDEATGHVVDVSFDTETADGTSSWELTFTDYGAEMKVDLPDLGDGG